jgi:hypothetical protein
MLNMVGTDVGPRSTLQIILGAVGLFSGAMLNANVFGELAVLVSMMSHNNTMFLRKMTQVNTTLTNLQLGDEIKFKVRDFVIAN